MTDAHYATARDKFLVRGASYVRVCAGARPLGTVAGAEAGERGEAGVRGATAHCAAALPARPSIPTRAHARTQRWKQSGDSCDADAENGSGPAPPRAAPRRCALTWRPGQGRRGLEKEDEGREGSRSRGWYDSNPKWEVGPNVGVSRLRLHRRQRNHRSPARSTHNVQVELNHGSSSRCGPCHCGPSRSEPGSLSRFGHTRRQSHSNRPVSAVQAVAQLASDAGKRLKMTSKKPKLQVCARPREQRCPRAVGGGVCGGGSRRDCARLAGWRCGMR